MFPLLFVPTSNDKPLRIHRREMLRCFKSKTGVGSSDEHGLAYQVDFGDGLLSRILIPNKAP